MQVFQALRERLALEAFEFFTDVALRHVVAHGAQAPFEREHPYYVVVDAAADGTDDARLLEAFAHCAGQDWVEDGVIAQSQAQAAQLWRLREGITEALAPHLPYKNDVAVRVSAMPAFLAAAQALLAAEYPEFEVAWFGHIGDGNLHINVLKPDGLDQDAFVARCGDVTAHLAGLVQQHAGTISAEHGIGLVKKPYLDSTRSPAEVAVMQAVRAALDPDGILNPGKIFDPPTR